MNFPIAAKEFIIFKVFKYLTDKLMKKIFSVLFLLFLMNFSVFAQQITDANFQIFDGKGNAVSLEQIIKNINQSEVVFLGEQHDDTVAHFLQAEIFKKTVENYAQERKVALSLEMFERDAQLVLDEYLQDLITEKKFLDDSRPWGNYKTDYRPLVELAKQNKFPVIAANAPRRYVNMVSRNGRNALDKLSPTAKSWLAPLPYEKASSAYAAKFNALMGRSAEASMGLGNILDSQTLWDATMAHSIAEHLKKEQNSLIVHLNGSFHTESRLGTVEQLLRYRPNTKIIVITMRYEEDFKNFDKAKHTDLGDYIVLTDAKLPRSQR